MDTQQNMESRLWEYIDGHCTTGEKTVIDQLLENNRQWKEKYTELMNIHLLMQSTELEEPSMRFTKNVMEKLTRYQINPVTKKYINQKIIWGISAFFILLFTGFLIYGLGQLKWGAGGGNSLGIDFSKIDFSIIFSNTYVNIFMMINIIIGLFLFDRFLATKRKQFNKEA